MMEIIYDKNIQKVPVKIWSQLDTVEPDAVKQLQNMASLPFVFKHVAAMPDVHVGKGATVGSVIATKNAVIPAAVGVDIGCGMMAVKLNVRLDELKDKCRMIRDAIEATIPVGFSENKHATGDIAHWAGWNTWDQLYASKFRRVNETDLKAKALKQIGTLGGGNHFIELCEDTEGHPWIMLHSGSRGIGNNLASLHIDNAKDVMKKMFISLPDKDLAYYVENTEDYDRYMFDLHWAQDYALYNREIMMKRILRVVAQNLGIDAESPKVITSINCHHNYASKENHYGENVLITRKGAVRARAGDLGIIPGSMGAKSFIVRGLGNDESFHSCSHGAGRKMSRTKAKANFTIDDLNKQTEGVDCRKDEGVLDEIPGAYKDIDLVMNNQKDLVEIVAQLKQFMCIKG